MVTAASVPPPGSDPPLLAPVEVRLTPASPVDGGDASLRPAAGVFGPRSRTPVEVRARWRRQQTIRFRGPARRRRAPVEVRAKSVPLQRSGTLLLRTWLGVGGVVTPAYYAETPPGPARRRLAPVELSGRGGDA